MDTNLYFQVYFLHKFLTSFSVNFPNDAVESLLMFNFSEIWKKFVYTSKSLKAT